MTVFLLPLFLLGVAYGNIVRYAEQQVIPLLVAIESVRLLTMSINL